MAGVAHQGGSLCGTHGPRLRSDQANAAAEHEGCVPRVALYVACEPEPEPEPEPDLLLTKSKLCARAQAAARALTSSESDATYTLATPYLSRSRSACARYSCGTAVAGP